MRHQRTNVAYDEHGRPHVKGVSAPMMKKWTEWLAYWIEDLSDAEVNETRFLRDACLFLHSAELAVARFMRKHADWSGPGTSEDWMPIFEKCERHLAWFHRNAPHDEYLSVHGRLFKQAIGGALANLIRLAREIQDVKDNQGLVAVNINPYARVTDMKGVEQ